MTRFHKLTNNQSEFPHINTVDVYKYDNGFDYARYNATQMELQLCAVPWDMGEAHIGARTISGIGNVVWFETKEKRDAWFDAIPDDECYRFTTKYKELHRDLTVDVPIPYDMAAKYNYMRVHYSMFANDESPVHYEEPDGVRDWFWFIREVEFVAPNTTRLHILDDAFQTWMYDIHVAGMVLERGHAPMFAIDADTYLDNPISNNTYLLTEDVNFGTASQVKHIDALALNANDMYACIATTGYMGGNWGSKADNSWKVPAGSHYSSGGVPSVAVFAMPANMLNTFLTNVTYNFPQFKQTIQGIFFASLDLIALGEAFTFADVTCYWVSAGRQTLELSRLEKSQFGYPSKYADIAKLYTSPYAHIEVTDENGNIDTIRIEDTTGELDVSAAMSLAYPFINIETHLLGVGGTVGASVTFRNLTAKTFPVRGRWYDTLKSWKVPTFAVVLDPSRQYDYATHFDRIQARANADTAYNNTTASAATNNANTKAAATTAATDQQNSATAAATNQRNSATTARDNEVRSAEGMAANTENQNEANRNKISDLLDGGSIGETGGSGGFLARSYDANLTKASDDTDADRLLTAQMAGLEQNFAAASAIANSGASLGGAISSGAAMGSAMGVYGAVGGAAAGAITSVASTTASTFIAINNNSNIATVTDQHALSKFEAARDNMKSLTQAQIIYNEGCLSVDNALNSMISDRWNGSSGINATNAGDTANTAIANANRERDTTIANANRDRDTAHANADRTKATIDANANRDWNNAISAINNRVKQAALNAPFVYGAFSNGETAVTKPMALFANIVTQSKSAIAAAGDEFLRYGYMYDKQWDFNGNWNIGKYFTYWKLRDFWVKNLNVPDMYVDKIRFFLFGGVTVWRRPEDIGNRSVYENYN